MNTIIRTLNQKWAMLLAFIPGVNLAYLIFRLFVGASKSCKISFITCGLIGLPFCILYRFVPDSWNWLVAHLMLSSITAFVMVKSRGYYYPQLRFPKEAIPFLVCLIIVGTVLIRFGPELSRSSRASANAKAALNAIVQDDDVAWQALIHPEYGKSLMNLQHFKKRLESKGIVLSEDFTFGVAKSAAAPERVEEGSAVGLDEYIRSDGKTYLVSVIYLETESGSGFIDFQIISKRN